jgi:formyltetrahydrofolate synthetase
MGKSKISYSWVINGFDAKISQDSKDNVIHSIHWSYNANKGDHNANMIGSDQVEYKDLKKSDVIGWLEAKLDVAKMQKSLSDQIALKEAPVDVMLKPEW